jgi:hypothetical protein
VMIDAETFPSTWRHFSMRLVSRLGHSFRELVAALARFCQCSSGRVYCLRQMMAGTTDHKPFALVDVVLQPIAS